MVVNLQTFIHMSPLSSALMTALVEVIVATDLNGIEGDSDAFGLPLGDNLFSRDAKPHSSTRPC